LAEIERASADNNGAFGNELAGADTLADAQILLFDYSVKLLGYAKDVDFNFVGDTRIDLTLPAAATTYRFSLIRIVNRGTTASLTTAQFGVFTQPAGAPIALVTGGSSMATITSNTVNVDRNAMEATFAVSPFNSFNYDHLFFRITQAQGAAASGDVFIFGFPMP
jgi:hypothetical protein